MFMRLVLINLFFNKYIIIIIIIIIKAKAYFKIGKQCLGLQGRAKIKGLNMYEYGKSCLYIFFYRLNDKLSSNTNFGHFRWLRSRAQVFIS